MLTRPTARNLWPDESCAKAFWYQHEAGPYRQLLEDTLDWCAPAAGERWLDLGCGGGRLTRGLWERTGGALAGVVGVDCAPANTAAYAKLRRRLSPSPGDRVGFLCHDFSSGLGPFADGAFDHAVSGLSVSYAESYSEVEGRWTDAGYDRVLAEARRVVRPGGRFVFSVNVPEPRWWLIGLLSAGTVFRTGRPIRFLLRAARMLRYGAWLKREARAGRFHYLPADAVARKLAAAGFGRVEYRPSYAGQAFIFRAVVPG